LTEFVLHELISFSASHNFVVRVVGLGIKSKERAALAVVCTLAQYMATLIETIAVKIITVLLFNKNIQRFSWLD
jgi:hypothetical protein